MPSGSDFISNQVIKTIYAGDSGTGKTGSLVSLVQAGYKVRVLDLDAGVGTLINYVRRQCPDKLADGIGYMSPRDKYKTDQTGVVLDGPPTAFIQAMKCLDEWEDGTHPRDWGPEYVLAVDSTTRLGKSAYNWFNVLNPVVKDKRQIYNIAQRAFEDFLSNVTAESFNTNVILITHIAYNESETKGFPSAIGKALGPLIPTYFNNFILAEASGTGDKVKRVIRTRPTGIVTLKTENSEEVDDGLPIETGLATLFATLKGNVASQQ
jgi:hypothetical protein